ncbi:MAG: Rieske 2Fe-2S domain-containing protein, partial [Gammaproteobacteria bacterium]|nr:Rieske 2Fe-2S domain-containing protein [Gammaproteobacteria bacterium]
MSSEPKDDDLHAASKTPAFRKVKRVAPEQSPVTPCGKEPDPDLGHELIRKERYTTPEFMQLEWERIWTRVWLLGAVEQDLREPGDFVATEIGRESVLLVRQNDGGVRAFYNVCLHRGNRLRPTGTGSADSFKCQYHH